MLDPGPPHVLAVGRVELDDGTTQHYTFGLTDWPLRAAAGGDGMWRALLTAIAENRVIASLPRTPDGPASAGPASVGLASAWPVTATLVCRSAGALDRIVPGARATIQAFPERGLGADQSNTSTVFDERLLLKAFRRLEPGLNPDLELMTFLTEVAGFAAVPPLAGYAQIVSVAAGSATAGSSTAGSATAGTTTVALAQAFVADGADAFETIAESLTGWLLARDVVSLDSATAVAADLGALTAGLHAALADGHGVTDFEPRLATRDELRGWARGARLQLARAVDVTPGEAGKVLRDLAARIAEELTVFEALSSLPLLTRVHGDFHLGQVLIAPGGYRIVDFEGEPLRPLEERRAHQSPLRDAASMLRSLDHVGRSAGRRVVARNGGPIESAGLDLAAWRRRSRSRFLDAYRAGLREAGAPIVVDAALLRAFEIEKECYEFIYASTYLPTWLWAPTEGMRGLFKDEALARR